MSGGLTPITGSASSRARRAGLKAAALVVLEDRLDHLFGLVDDLHQVEILAIDHALGDQPVVEPVDQALPERAVHQYETGAGGSAPKHVQQLVEENHPRCLFAKDKWN